MTQYQYHFNPNVHHGCRGGSRLLSPSVASLY